VPPLVFTGPTAIGQAIRKGKTMANRYNSRYLIKRRFRGNAPFISSNPNFGSIRWACDYGKQNAKLIRSIRAGGYKKAREYFNFYSDKRTAHGAALRALSLVKRIGNPRPFYIERNGDSGMIYALSLIETVEHKTPRYLPMRRVGRS
tara:strand:+ start:1547 stop:1987 length:441 start_codon:yes stop_codon:yes gene_type:complete